MTDRQVMALAAFSPVIVLALIVVACTLVSMIPVA
jgi:hypothetical protein